MKMYAYAIRIVDSYQTIYHKGIGKYQLTDYGTQRLDEAMLWLTQKPAYTYLEVLSNRFPDTFYDVVMVDLDTSERLL